MTLLKRMKQIFGMIDLFIGLYSVKNFHPLAIRSNQPPRIQQTQLNTGILI